MDIASPATAEKSIAHSSGSVRMRLIEAASRLFCRLGINAVGVDAVIAEAGTAKASLYKNFGSKEGLVEAVLTHEGACWRDWFLDRLHDGEAKPAERLERIFPILKEWFARENFFGCPFINAIGEHDKADDRLRQLTIAHKMVVLNAIEALAAEAGTPDPALFAHQIGLLMDGAIIAAMVTKDPGSADLAQATALLLIRSSFPDDATVRRLVEPPCGH